MTNRKILLVDDDDNLRASLKRQLRGQYDLGAAESGEAALRTLAAEGPFAVIVADMRMSGMSGIELLATTHEKWPDTSRIMLTGNADIQTAIDAVNNGQVFRFLCKPCPQNALQNAIEAGIEQYRLVTTERQLLQETLVGVVRSLGDLLSLANPLAFGRATRCRRLMGMLARRMGQKPSWEFEVAGMLSQIGMLTLPASVVEKVSRGAALTSVESELVEGHPRIGHDLVGRIPRLENAALVIALQDLRSGAAETTADGTVIPVAARALHVVLDYDSLIRSGKTPLQALAEIQRTAGYYDPRVLEALEDVVREDTFEEKQVSMVDLMPGMVLAANIQDVSGAEFENTKGREVTEPMITWLRNSKHLRIKEPIAVMAPISRNV